MGCLVVVVPGKVIGGRVNDQVGRGLPPREVVVVVVGTALVLNGWHCEYHSSKLMQTESLHLVGPVQPLPMPF